MATLLRHVQPASPPRTPTSPLATRRIVPAVPGWRSWLAGARASLLPLLAVAEAGYGAALLGVALATFAALGLGLGSEPGVFAPFFVALTAVALRYGVGPALLTIACAVIATYVWLFSPMLALAVDPAAFRRLAFFRLSVFTGAGALITLFAETHRQTLLDLERSRRQLRAFTTDADVGLQVIDHDGRIVWSDNETARFLGYEPAEWVGAVFTRFHADRILGADVQTRLAAGMVVENVRATLLRKDGVTQDVLLSSNSLLGDARTPGSGVLLAVLPMTSTVAAVDGTKLAVAALLERRRQAAATRIPSQGERP